MKKVIVFTAIVIFVIAINDVKSYAQNQKNDKPIQLFNGQNLDGWFNQDHGILYLDSIPYFAKGMHFLLLYLLLL